MNKIHSESGLPVAETAAGGRSAAETLAFRAKIAVIAVMAFSGGCSTVPERAEKPSAQKPAAVAALPAQAARKASQEPVRVEKASTPLADRTVEALQRSEMPHTSSDVTYFPESVSTGGWTREVLVPARTPLAHTMGVKINRIEVHPLADGNVEVWVKVSNVTDKSLAVGVACPFRSAQQDAREPSRFNNVSLAVGETKDFVFRSKEGAPEYVVLVRLQ